MDIMNLKNRLKDMNEKEMKDYFNELALNWDQHEKKTESEITELLSILNIKKGDKILDVACGTGVATKILHSFSLKNVDAIDLSDNMIEIAKEKYKNYIWANFICDDFTKIKFKKKYNFVVIYNAYPHFMNLVSFNNALVRSVKKGGKFAIVHSMSREKLQLHHKNLSMQISRSLKSPLEEFENFKSDFRLVKAFEDNSCYILIGEKN